MTTTDEELGRLPAPLNMWHRHRRGVTRLAAAAARLVHNEHDISSHAQDVGRSTVNIHRGADASSRLTVGSANGAISELLGKIKAINAKHGKFDLVLCLGDFFSTTTQDAEGDEGEALMLLDDKLEGVCPTIEVACSELNTR